MKFMFAFIAVLGFAYSVLQPGNHGELYYPLININAWLCLGFSVVIDRLEAKHGGGK